MGQTDVIASLNAATARERMRSLLLRKALSTCVLDCPAGADAAAVLAELQPVAAK
jgi:hypothetical protein